MQLRSHTAKAIKYAHQAYHSHIQFKKMQFKSADEFTQFVSDSNNQINPADLIAFIKTSLNRYKVNSAYLRLMQTADLALLQELRGYTRIGSNVDLGYYTVSGERAVLAACQYGRIDVLKWLVNDLHLPVDAKSKNIDGAIVTAISFNQIDLLHELIRPVQDGGFGLQFNLRTHNHRKHPVMRAIHDGNEIMLRELVKPCAEGGFGLSLDDVRDELNYQPAMQAALAGHVDLFAELIKPVAEGGFGKPYSIDSELLNFPYNTNKYSNLHPYVMTIQHSRIATDNHETLTVMDMQNRTTEVYKLGKQLGAGSYGSVHEFVFNDKKFAVKVPRDGWYPCSKRNLSEEYQYDGQEFLMMCKANPSNGPYALQSLRKMVDGKYVASSRMIMPIIPGVHITAALQVTKDPLLAAKIILKSTQALQEVHMNGVLHSDIRPGNILVDGRDDGKIDVHIIDYGFSCLIGKIAPVLVPDLYKFFPPERIDAQVLAHTSQDVWSLARTIQWSLTPPLLRILDEFPAVAELVEGGLQNDPELRPTLASFIQKLQTQIHEYESKAAKIHEVHQTNKRHQYVTGNRFFIEDKMRKKSKLVLEEVDFEKRHRR